MANSAAHGEAITFLGAGLIGSGLIAAAEARGDQVVVYNRTRAKADALASSKVRVAETALSACEQGARIHIALSDDQAVDAVLESALPALAGKLVIDHTTTLPRGTAERSLRLAQAGVRYLHAPVFMSPAMCKSASGIMLAAGPEQTYAEAEPSLAKMTGKLMYLGERPDLAAAYKLFGNAMIIGITGAFADVLSIAAQLGVEPTAAHALFSSFNAGATLAGRGKQMAEGQYQPSFELSMARKDVRLMLESAGGAALCVLPSIAARMDELIAAGHGSADLGVLAVGAVPPAGS